MAPVPDPGALLNVVSGVVMGALGLALLMIDPERDWNRLFGLLALFWGVQIVAANAVRLTTDPDVALFSGLVSLAFLIPLYFFITAFAATFPRPRGSLGTSPLAVAALALPAGGALAALFLDPELLLAGITTLPDGSLTLSWGPLLPYLVTAPFFGALSYALYTMMQRLETAPSTTERKQVTFVLAAVAAYTAYYAPAQLVKFGSDALGLGEAAETGSADAGLIALIMLITVVILAAVVVRLVGRREAAQPAPVRHEAGLVLGVIAVASGAAVLGMGLQAVGGPQLELVGLFRLASVALIVYAIARYQLFDIDVRAKQWSAVAAASLAVVALGAAAWVGLTRLSIEPAMRGAGVAVVAAVSFLPTLHLAYRLADRVAPEVSYQGDHTYLRKLEVYRAAVEDQLVDGQAPEPDDPSLVEMRERLGLNERDHNVVVTLASAQAEPTEHQPQMEPGGRAFGKYELEEVIAEGGFGRILRARDTVLNRPVVIKELLAKWREHEQVVQRFLREAQVAGQITHPNIVSVYGVERHGGDHYVVMEHVAGGTLADRIAQGPLDVVEATRITQGILSGLQAAHAQDVVHRDVKPGNVLLGPQGEVKLADFGIAYLTRSDPDETLVGLGAPAVQPGTLSAMSPEQAEGQPVDHRTDLYAAGALLYRMLTGQPHVELDGLDEVEARRVIADGPTPELPEDVPAEIAEVLEKALRPDPGDRFQTALGFQQTLDEALDAWRDQPTQATTGHGSRDPVADPEA